MKELSKQDVYSRATELCSKSEKCISDVRKKLYDWQVEVEWHEEVIDALVENKYIDEERYATYFVRDKYRFNKWGKIKIRHHLTQKGITDVVIQEAFTEIDEELYHEILIKALKTKDKSIKTDDKYERRHKLMRFAAGRGYTLDEINQALETIL